MQAEPIAEERGPDFDPGKYLTISEVARMTGLHKNTIRNYVLRRELEATFIDNGVGRQKWVISKRDLLTCGIPELTARLDQDEIKDILDSQEQKKIRQLEETVDTQKQRIEELTWKLEAEEKQVQRFLEGISDVEDRARREVAEDLNNLRKVIWILFSSLDRKSIRRLEQENGITFDGSSWEHLDIYCKGEFYA